MAISVTLSSANAAAVNNGGTLSSFTLFPKLPAEIRLRIWSFSCFYYRNVDVSARNVEVAINYDIDDCFYFATESVPPAILSVSREARVEGLKYYKLLFGVTQKLGMFEFSTPPRIYFNTDSDRLVLLVTCKGLEDCEGDCEDDPAASKASALIRKYKIRRLAINCETYYHLAYGVPPRKIPKWLTGGLDEIYVFGPTDDMESLNRIEFIECEEAKIQDIEHLIVVKKDIDLLLRRLQNGKKTRRLRERVKISAEHLEFGKKAPDKSPFEEVEWTPPKIKLVGLRTGLKGMDSWEDLDE